MSDVFISYSRRDKEFVRRLHAALEQHGREAWVDWADIPPASEWMREVEAGIEASHTVVFIISPDSIASEVCSQELNHAVKHHKRLVPVLHRAVDPASLPSCLSAHNWIFFQDTDDFDEAFQVLLRALDTDLNWVRHHTRLLTKALEWDHNERDFSIGLRGRDLEQAERWLAEAATGKEPLPTELQIEYILASRRDVMRRQRALIGGSGLAAVLVLGSSLLGWQHWRSDRQDRASALCIQGALDLQQRNIPDAELYAAEALALDDRPETRERLLEARARDAALLRVTVPGGGAVTAVDPCGERLLVKDTSGKLLVRDVWGRQADVSLQGHPASTLCSAFNRNGSLVAVGEKDGRVDLWQARTGRLVYSVSAPAKKDVLAVSFSADSRWLASGGKDRAVTIWDTSTGARRATVGSTRDRIMCVAFSPDGSTIAAAGWDHYVWLGNLSGQNAALHAMPEVAHEDAILSIAFSPDGRTLATGSWDNRIYLWDVKKQDRLQAFVGHTDGVSSLAFNPNGQWLASVSQDRTVRLWDVSSGQNILTLSGYTGNVDAVGFSPDGQRLISGGEDGTARVWDVAHIGIRDELTTLRGCQAPVSAVAFSPDGKTLASGSWDNQVWLWDLQTRQPRAIGSHQDEVTCIEYSPDGSMLATGGKDRVVQLWSASTGRLLTRLPHPMTVRHLAFSPDGRQLASVGDDGVLRLWDPRSGRRLSAVQAHPDKALAVAFSPDGRELATSGSEKFVRVWKLDAAGVPQPLFTLNEADGAVWDVSFSPDGKQLISGSDDGKAVVWDLVNHQRLNVLDGHHGAAVWDVAYSPDGRHAASAGQDNSVMLWDLQTGKSIALRCMDGPAWWVCFSRDGTQLAAGSMDHTIRIWKIPVVLRLMERPANSFIPEAEKESGLRLDFTPSGRATANPIALQQS